MLIQKVNFKKKEIPQNMYSEMTIQKAEKVPAIS